MSGEEKTSIFKKKISRRDMLKLTGIGTAGAVIGASGFGGILTTFGENPLVEEKSPVNNHSFYGKYQSGIATQGHEHGYFMSLNCTAKSKVELQELFKVWTKQSAALMAGKLIEPNNPNTLLPAKDTGETVGLNSSNLTLTFGVGPPYTK